MKKEYQMIGVLVYAKDSDAALSAAREIVCEKLGNKSAGGKFAKYTDFAKDNSNGLSHKNRREQIPAVLQVSTARYPSTDMRGLKMVNDAMEKTKMAFKRMMAVIRYHMSNYTDDQLFNEVEGKGDIVIDGVNIDDWPRFFREYCGHLGNGDQGRGIFLYDQEGCGVTSPIVLQRYLNGWNPDSWPSDEIKGQDPYWNQPLWVVPFEAHR